MPKVIKGKKDVLGYSYKSQYVLCQAITWIHLVAVSFFSWLNADTLSKRQGNDKHVFQKTKMPRTEEGQIYYVRNELYSIMAHFKHERQISENRGLEVY